MRTLSFTTLIKASAARVWQILWGDETYTIWAEAFGPGSLAVTDWKKNSEVRFTDPSGAGMLAVIDEKITNHFMAFRTIGILAKGGLKDLESEAARAWAGMLETYTLIESGDTTRLDVNLTFNEISDDMLKMFEAMWPKALQAVKSLSEANS